MPIPRSMSAAIGQSSVTRADGKKLAEIALQGEPRCLAVGAFDHAKPGQLYVGMDDHVEVYDPQGTRVAVWIVPRPRGNLHFDHDHRKASLGCRRGQSPRLAIRSRRATRWNRRRPARSVAASNGVPGHETTTSTWPREPMIWSTSSIRACCAWRALRTTASMKPLGARDRRRWPISSAAATRPSWPCCPTAAS